MVTIEKCKIRYVAAGGSTVSAEVPRVFQAGGHGGPAYAWECGEKFLDVLCNHKSGKTIFTTPFNGQGNVASGSDWQRPDSNSHLQRCPHETSPEALEGVRTGFEPGPTPGPRTQRAAYRPHRLPSRVS